eukprot:14763768-Alexandrium_andersonii.AAC.1
MPPRKNAHRGRPRCTRPLIFSEVIDTVSLDGIQELSGVPWDEEYLMGGAGHRIRGQGPLT